MYKIRHTERRETLAYWPARDEQSGESVGLVTDLSEEGVSLHSQSSFEPGHRFNLRMAVDPKLAGVTVIHLHVETIWCQPSGIAGCFHSGFKLLNASFETRDAIRKLLTAFSYPIPRFGVS